MYVGKMSITTILDGSAMAASGLFIFMPMHIQSSSYIASVTVAIEYTQFPTSSINSLFYSSIFSKSIFLTI